MPLSRHDRDLLRSLAQEQAEIAALPIHREKAELWRRLNQLEPVRPMVWINEVCWNEMNVDDELTLRAEDPWARGQESGFRMMLYQWRHLPGDMIVNDYLSCPLVIHSTGLGISEKVDIRRTDETSGVVSRQFHRQIWEPSDVEKIKFPEVTYDAEATERNYERMCEVYDGILPVTKVGRKGTWFAPWDNLIRWWGVEDAMIDLADRPEMVNEIMTHLVDAYLYELDQWEALNLLSRNDDNTRIGSGGYGHTDELPGDDYDPDHVKPKNMWGCATAQIFSDVSPDMHWEFALKHELRWLERWGLTYYGCCEPLDTKVEILRRVPNLRKLSMSPWIDTDRAIAKVGTDYVLSRKPNPAVLASDDWHPERARRELRDFLDKARGCHVELILKDISTVRYDPRRLWEWETIAMEVAEEYAP
ncbi:hypothetical protein FJZ36_08085 [Candidatus Poribacteria bacterium]|nr:hypothetical protein [Candidatus Poribacteria bacterium]